MITFTSGTKAKASEVNANFLELLNLVNSLSTDYSKFIQKDGSVDFTKLQGYATSEISGASNATPIVVTSTNHGRSNGDIVYISGVAGNTAANGAWTVANKTTNTFELVGSVGNGTYTSGGICLQFPDENEDIPNKGYVDYKDALDDKIIALGTLSTTGTTQLTNRREHTATVTANAVISMPTSTSDADYAFLYFTTTNASYPTISVTGWNYTNTQPTFSTTKNNLVKLHKSPIDGYWYGSYEQLGA